MPAINRWVKSYGGGVGWRTSPGILTSTFVPCATVARSRHGFSPPTCRTFLCPDHSNHITSSKAAISPIFLPFNATVVSTLLTVVLQHNSQYTSNHLRWVHTCNVTACRNVASYWHDTGLRAEHSSRASRRDSTCERYRLGFPVCYGSPSDVFAASSGQWWRVTLPVHTCSGRNRIIPFMRRPNTDSIPNKPVT